jgi:hypothetical protein
MKAIFQQYLDEEDDSARERTLSQPSYLLESLTIAGNKQCV